MALVKKDGYAVRYASPELKNNPEIAKAAIAQNKEALKYISHELQRTDEFQSIVLNFVERDPSVLSNASLDRRKDRNFVFKAIMRNPKVPWVSIG